MSVTTGPTIPLMNCSHGVPQYLPCAACGRPYQPPATIEVHGDLAPVAEALNRIAKALERLAYVEEMKAGIR